MFFMKDIDEQVSGTRPGRRLNGELRCVIRPLGLV